MAELEAAAGALGWRELKTHLRSGNLVFTADGEADRLAAALEAELLSRFGLQVDVIIRTGQQLAALVAAHPWASGDPARTVIACCDRRVSREAAEKLVGLAVGDERVCVADEDVFASFPNGQASSKLAAGLVAALSPAVGTARNLNTMTKLVELLTSAQG
jgi:uncharacterized protein (DUF1697 family)